MNRGFTLIEVLVALVICMIIFTAAARLSLVSLRSGSYSENLTLASVFGHTKLASLVNLPATSAELEVKWHQDPANPISQGGMKFYRYWQVEDVEIGKKIVLYMAWDGSYRGRASGFGSEDELKGSGCSKVWFSDVLVPD
jgi:prepilin-type N-terminal cleavage/methylation domain-containing protein